MFSVTSKIHVHDDGAVNVGVLTLSDRRAVLFDYGDGGVLDALAEAGADSAYRVLVTHYHRDQVMGLLTRPPGPETTVTVPEEERWLFDDVARFWESKSHRWHLYNDRPQPPVLSENVEVHGSCSGGDVWVEDGVTISVIDTSGHTDHSVSYLVEADGERALFCGDLITGDGQLPDMYSLQKRTDGHSDYHGFLEARHEIRASLERVLDVEPTVLIPAHGPIITEPAAAIQRLLDRLDRCYDQYVAISALRHYMPDKFKESRGSPGHMPIQDGIDVPHFLHSVGTTWIILSETRELFVMDCGDQCVLNRVKAMIDADEATDVTEFWVTHYHDDHVNVIEEFQALYPCPTKTEHHVAPVITRPAAFRLPCQSKAVARIDHITEEGESWTWNEFTMTAFHFPGQTWYHGGLFVEGRDCRLLFAGDSFTMAGIDDYCSQNRNFLGAGVGYDHCLELVEKLRPTHIFSCHIARPFNFTTEQIRMMRENLAERERLFGELMPWDHPNFGTDASWVRCWPYEQDAAAGTEIELELHVTNHSASEQTVRARPMLPSEWGATIEAASADIPAKADGAVRFQIPIPADAATRRTAIPVDITFGGRRLGPIREGIVNVTD